MYSCTRTCTSFVYKFYGVNNICKFRIANTARVLTSLWDQVRSFFKYIMLIVVFSTIPRTQNTVKQRKYWQKISYLCRVEDNEGKSDMLVWLWARFRKVLMSSLMAFSAAVRATSLLGWAWSLAALGRWMTLKDVGAGTCTTTGLLGGSRLAGRNPGKIS